MLWSNFYEKEIRASIGVVLSQYPKLPLLFSTSETIPEIPAECGAVFCMGSRPKEALEAHKLFAKNRTITSLRKTPYQFVANTTKFLMSYSPKIHEVDYSKYVDLLTDTGLAVRLALTGTMEPKLGKYEYVPDLTGILARINELYDATQTPVKACLDLETIGLDPYALPIYENGVEVHPGAYIVTIQVSVEPGYTAIVKFDNRNHEEARLHDIDFSLQLSELLTSPKVSIGGANLKFDTHWIVVRAGQYCSNFKFDTTLVGSLLDENRANGLDTHVKIYAPSLGGYSDLFDKTVDKSRMDLALKADPVKFATYAGGDTDGCLQVREAVTHELLKDPELTSFYVNILHPSARAFEHLEQTGVCVDRKAFEELQSDLHAEMDALIQKAKPLLGGRLIAKHSDEDKRGGLNLTKASLLNDFMFSPMGLNLEPKMFTEGSLKPGAKKGHVPSTAMEHLNMFRDVPEAKEFVGVLKAYSSAAKTLSTYVVGFLKHLRSDGKFHPAYNFFTGNRDEGEGGAVTGRLSATNPAFQTVPKHSKWAKPLRRCYPAPPGYLILEADYSQGELKVMACLSNEENMIQAYRDSLDLHVVTSGNFAGYSYDEMMKMKKENTEQFDEIRQLGKAGNFGLLYGMGEEGFRDYAEANYGVKLSLKDAAKFRDGFFETYPRLLPYHGQQKNAAHRQGLVRGPLGRIRHLPLINSANRSIVSQAERQSINSPTQGTLSDMTLWSIAIAHQQDLHLESPCFAAVHDAAYKYIPADNPEKYVKQTLEIMENLPFDKIGWAPQLKFTCDGKVGPNLAELSKLS